MARTYKSRLELLRQQCKAQVRQYKKNKESKETAHIVTGKSYWMLQGMILAYSTMSNLGIEDAMDDIIRE